MGFLSNKATLLSRKPSTDWLAIASIAVVVLSLIAGGADCFQGNRETMP